ncbi:MAG: IS66 family transposase [Acidimicrobiales bacterium]
MSDQGWANELADLLIEARDAVEAAKAEGKDRLDPSVLHSIRVRYGTLVKKDWAANLAPEVGTRSGYNKNAANLLVRLDTQRDDVLRFAADFRASFTNNQGERDIRMVKLQQKIPGSWRSLDGAWNYCAIRSYIIDDEEARRRRASRAAPAVRRSRLASRCDLRHEPLSFWACRGSGPRPVRDDKQPWPDGTPMVTSTS